MLDFDVKQVERYMEIKSWSQAELARKMGISESYLSRILRGERMPGRKFIGSLLQTCKGLEFDDVFFLWRTPRQCRNFYAGIIFIF